MTSGLAWSFEVGATPMGGDSPTSPRRHRWVRRCARCSSGASRRSCRCIQHAPSRRPSASISGGILAGSGRRWTGSSTRTTPPSPCDGFVASNHWAGASAPSSASIDTAIAAASICSHTTPFTASCWSSKSRPSWWMYKPWSEGVDVKVRVAPWVARDLGWRPRLIVPMIVMAEGTTPRRRVADLEPLFGRYSLRGHAATKWLRDPRGSPTGVLVFSKLPSSDGIDARRAGRRRVRPTRAVHAQLRNSEKGPGAAAAT